MSKAKAKGTTAEREVVRYLQNWWPAAERRALSGNRDRGDVAGIRNLVVEVKAAKAQLIGPWQRETLIEMANDGSLFCMLVVKRPYKSVSEWDAYLPGAQLPVAIGPVSRDWVRLDLALAVPLLRAAGI